MTPGRSVLRDNIFLVAAVALPLIVVAFFLAASAIPRWMVPPPSYDLLLKASDGYSQTNPRAVVDFEVRDGRVEATIRRIPSNGFGVRLRLFLFDHATLTAREIAFTLPDDIDSLEEGDPPRRILVDALEGRRVVPQLTAPDGYQLRNQDRGGSGIVGEVFGMRRYDSGAALVNRGRVIPIELPTPYQNVYLSPVDALGWLVENGQR